MTATPPNIASFIAAAVAIIDAHATEVADLDQTIGDGDHIINLQRGLTALEAESATLATLDWPTVFQRMGTIVMSQVGGASGSLYATLFMTMSRALRDQPFDRLHLATAFDLGVAAVKQRGKSDEGEKTLLDVWVPLARELNRCLTEEIPLLAMLERLNETATKGCESTRDLIATKGRASFLGERARGHIDPGARTSELLLHAITSVLAEQTAQPN